MDEALTTWCGKLFQLFIILMVKNYALTLENDCGLNNLKLWPLVINGLKVNSSNLDLHTSELFTFNPPITRSHNFKLFRPQSFSRVRASFFTIIVINDWNNLPHHVVNASSVNDFKILLDSSWSTLMYDYFSFCTLLWINFCRDQASQAY